MSLEEQIAQLRAAIAAQEGLRPVLGDATVDSIVSTLRQRLAEIEAQQPRAEQRKLVTVLFADLSGFNALAEQMDAEDVGALINAAWERLDGVVAAHGGRIDKHVGDAIMALWGADQAREDDATRAVRAALAMQQAVHDWGVDRGDHRDRVEFRGTDLTHLADLESEILLRIGINTGPVLLGMVGTTQEFTAMGDTVNLASRLQQIASVGEVLISHETYQLVRGLFEVEAQEPVRVKGKADLVRAYAVLQAAPRSFRMRTRGVEGIETHMVGRDAELLMLQEAFTQAMTQSQVNLAVVVGEVGVGKSRLLYEFEKWLRLWPDPVLYFRGRATPEMIDVPYGLTRDMFRDQFDILDNDDAARVWEKFQHGMAPYLDVEQAALVGRLVGFEFGTANASPALPSSAAGDQAQVFAGLAREHLLSYFQQVTREARVVILLEDIHWADSLTLEWMAQLPAHLAGQRLLVVGVTRPTIDERYPGWSQRPGLLRLELRPLTADDSRHLVSEILQKVENPSDALVDLVVQSAEGNPFYVEELIKMLIEDGVVQRDAQHWAADLGKLKQARVPTTLSGVLQARLDSLPADEKALLQRASVVGRMFWDTAVEAMQDTTEDAAGKTRPGSNAGALLSAVEGRELIFRRGHSTFAGTQEYIFKHAILRDVTYETVLLRLRRVYHAQVAAWLEANAGERIGEYLGLIAGHFELAGEPVKAMDYLGWAADRAFAISAFREAQAFLQRGLRLAETPTDGVDAACQRELSLEFQARLGETLYSLGNYAEARQLLEGMAGEARRLGLGAALAVATRVLGQLAIAEGGYAQAKELMQEALVLARRAGDHLAEARSLRTLGLAAENLGDLDEAETCYRQGLVLFQKVGDQMGSAGALANLGSLAAMHGKPEEAAVLYEQAWAIFTEIGFRWGAAYALIRLGQVWIESGEYPRAQEHLEKGLQICQEIGHRWGIAFASIYLGEALHCQGENAAAEQMLLQAVRQADEIQALPTQLNALTFLAVLYQTSGRLEEAARLASLVQASPTSDQEDKRRAQQLLEALAQALPPETYASAVARGQADLLPDVISRLLGGR